MGAPIRRGISMPSAPGEQPRLGSLAPLKCDSPAVGLTACAVQRSVRVLT